MNFFKRKIPLVGLILLIEVFFSCRPKLKFNEFNIYVDEDSPGWHFIDLSYDTIDKNYHRIKVKFAKGQTFQTATISSAFTEYLPTFLDNNGDTINPGLLSAGEYIYDSLQRKFLCFYTPTKIQPQKIGDFIEDSTYDSLRNEMDSIVENYLRLRNEIK